MKKGFYTYSFAILIISSTMSCLHRKLAFYGYFLWDTMSKLYKRMTFLYESCWQIDKMLIYLWNILGWRFTILVNILKNYFIYGYYSFLRKQKLLKLLCFELFYPLFISTVFNFWCWPILSSVLKIGYANLLAGVCPSSVAFQTVGEEQLFSEVKNLCRIYATSCWDKTLYCFITYEIQCGIITRCVRPCDSSMQHNGRAGMI